jgi:hypothetical protein
MATATVAGEEIRLRQPAFRVLRDGSGGWTLQIESMGERFDFVGLTLADVASLRESTHAPKESFDSQDLCARCSGERCQRCGKLREDLDEIRRLTHRHSYAESRGDIDGRTDDQ